MSHRNERKQTGQLGEQRAAHFLSALGYTIIETNWRCSLGEIDIVARDMDTLVFVEVRTKRSTAYGSAEDSITSQKLRRMQRLAYAYLQNHHISSNIDFRVDVLAIVLLNTHATFNHLRSVG
jgi:putative endonuclease